MSNAIETRLPCPDRVVCRSSDAYVIYDDGHGHCYSCGNNFSERENMTEKEEEYTIEFLSYRGIGHKTMQHYGVAAKVVDGEAKEFKFPYGRDAAKFRSAEEKEFWTKGEFKDAGLFGQDIFDPGSKGSITITEGEFDAMAVYDMLRGSTAAVSLKSGASGAYKDATKSYDYINSFDKIYLALDNDKPGKEAAQALQGLWDFRKVYHVKFHKYKDANEYLQNNAADDFVQTWKSAKRFSPDNIISSFKDIESTLNTSTEDKLGEYPFPDMNDQLYGLYAGEVIVVKAPEGVGKTEFFRALEHHLIKTTKHNVGIIHLEEDNATTVKAIAGYELGVPAVLPDCGLSKSDILAGYKAAVRDDEGRVHIHSSFDVEDEQAFLGNIRFLVSAAGCRFIFLDHISWLATGLADEDERKKLDRISQKLKLLAKELRFCLIEISHVNDDGKTRGSRNISKVANTVISLDRDLLGGSTVTTILAEKVRLGGRTGPAGKAYFNRTTGRMESAPVLEIKEAKENPKQKEQVPF